MDQVSTSARRVPGLVRLGAFVLTAAGAAAGAQAQGTPAFSKVFSPDTIGPGSVTTLVFTIDTDGLGSPTSDLAFTDTLPAGMTIATPANAATTCGGTLSAPAGGSTITFSDGGLGPSSSCTISVNVTSSTPGTHMNTSGDLTSSAGNSGAATDDLVVATDRPGFSKSFSPATVTLGSRSTLTFTLDNTANGQQVFNPGFTDPFPAGIVVAEPSNASTTCAGGSITAVPGASTLSFSVTGALAAGASCTVAVDVIGSGAGSLGNLTGDLTSFDTGFSTLNSGKASAVLQVDADPLAFSKAFTDDPSPAGTTVTLEFTIRNFDRDFSATGITFTDDLDAALSGLAAVGLPLADPCGSGSSLTGTSLLTLTGGNLPPQGSCTFSVTLQVPGAAPTGGHLNQTSSVSATVDGSPVVGSPATETLFVGPSPILTKEFTDDPVAAGDSVTLQFSITNTSTTSSATDLAFLDELTTFLPFPISATLPATPCGAGSSISLVSLGSEMQGLQLSAGSLAASGSCTFDVTIDVPVGMADGTYTNATTEVTGTIDAASVVGNSATDDLVVRGPPTLSKSFTDDPVGPGDTVTLEFTLATTAAVTDVAFTDALDAVVAGLAATGLPMNDVCGAGSSLTGTTNLSFTGGSLSADSECSFSVTLQVPGGATPGVYTNETSTVTATSGGLTATGPAASDTLLLAPVLFSKSFTDDPAIAGDLVTLEFTITNQSPTLATSDMFFSDDFDAVVTGLTVEGALPTDPCGAGSTLSLVGSTLSLTGGNLAAATSCSFSVSLRVPPATPQGSYLNTTSTLLVTMGGNTFTLETASDALDVDSERLFLTKTFTDDPVLGGQAATLEFTLSNLDAALSASAIGFTDDLDAALSGLAASALPPAGFCGAGSTISGTSVLTVSGASLGPLGSCTFSVTVQTPAAVPAGTTATNTTSAVGGTMKSLAVSGPPATDFLDFELIGLSKSFLSSVPRGGGTTTLRFTITNPDPSNAASDIEFSDDLDAALTGLVATGLPLADPCGTGSSLTGTSFLSFGGGSLAAGASCTFDVTVQVPAGAAVGDYTNVTSSIRATVGAVTGSSSAATATLSVVDVSPPEVTAVGSVPDTGDGQVSECEAVEVGLTQLTLAFDEPMNDPAGNSDADDVTNPANYLLVGAGPDGDFSTSVCGALMGDDVGVSIDSVTYDSGLDVATLGINGGAALPDELYRLFACASLTDVAGLPLDGDGDGMGSDDFVRGFRGEVGNVLTNGQLDCDLSFWSLASTSPGEIVWDAQDVDGSGASGSIHVTNLTASSTFSATQCIDTTSSRLLFTGDVRVDSADVSGTLLCRFFDQAACGGTEVDLQVVGSVSLAKGGTAGVWEALSGLVATPAGALSAACGLEVAASGGASFDLYADDLVVSPSSEGLARFLMPGQVQKGDLGPASEEVWFRTNLAAGRSYAVYGWVPGIDASVLTPALGEIEFFTDAGDTPATTVYTDDQEVDLDVPAGFVFAQTKIVPDATGEHFLRVAPGGAPPGTFTVEVLLVETTLFSPWWFVDAAQGYDGFVEVRNNAAEPVQVTVTAFDAAGAVAGTPSTLVVPGNGAVMVQVGATLGATDGFGSTQIAHTGPPGAISANVTVLSATTGLSYDAAFQPRMEWSTLPNP